jgi:dTDP-glucose 4,6-dehydratase
MRLQDQKILVTGADGFIGSHLVEELVRRGHSVRAFVLYNSFNSWGWLDSLPPEIRAKLEVVAGDVRDPQFVRDATKGCSVVFHLAALIAIPYSYRAPRDVADVNLFGTLNILEAARQHAVERVVQTSTSEVYGTAQFVPITEEHPLQAQSPYAATKIAADQMALSFYRSFDTPVTIARPFNTYGPRQSARAVIPAAVIQIARGARTIRLGATHPTRDFNYVEDTVRGLIALAESDRALGEVVNLGSNYEISIGETVKCIAEIMGRDLKVETDAERLRPEKSEVNRLWAENRKARELAGWVPEYAGRDGFREGLKRTIAWFTDPENLARYKADIFNV